MSELKPRLIKGLDADYVAATWPGSNTSGLKPLGANILLAVDTCSDVSAGGIRLPDDLAQRMTDCACTGVIFALGPEAFRLFDDGHRWTGEIPQAGDRVVFEKFSGAIQMGVDGRTYRVMSCRCVQAQLDTDNPEVMAIARQAGAAALRELELTGH